MASLSGCLSLAPEANLSGAVALVPPRYQAPAAEPVFLRQFWNSFGSQDLPRLINEAVIANPSVDAAREKLAQARAISEQAAASLLPLVSATASQSIFRASGTSAGLRTALPDTKAYAIGITASYEIDFWGKNAAAVRAAEHLEAAGAYSLAVTQLSVQAETALAWFDFVFAQDRLKTAVRNAELAKRIQRSLQERVAVGSATRIEAAQQATAVLQQEAAIPRIQRALEQSKVALAVLIGRTPGTVKFAATGLERLSVPPPTNLRTDLLRRRPDLRLAEERILASAENVVQAKAAMLPSISLSAGAGYQSRNLSSLLSPASAVYQLANNLAQPLLDERRLAAQLREKEGRRAELIALYRAAILAAVGDVDKALIAVRTTALEEAKSREALSSARDAYELSEEQLRAGQIDVLTVLSAQRTYFEALDLYQQVRLQRFQAAISLYRALAGGWSAEDLARSKAETP